MSKTLRLNFPQWQGGDNRPYYFGSQLLSFLAPKANGPVEDIAVEGPACPALPEENGIVGRSVLMKNIAMAEAAIARHTPDSIVVLGGDCLVDLVPFAYLSDKYGEDFGILWVDAHPDVMTPQDFNHAHAMVLGNLMGKGDADFTKVVKRPVAAENVMYAGLGVTLPVETDFIRENQLHHVGPKELNKSPDAVSAWIKARGIKYLAIHWDLDVLDPKGFHAVLFNDRKADAHTFDGITQGSMNLEAVQKVICAAGEATDVVGLGIAEHLPWDAMRLADVMASLPLLKS